jgi:hypothetical protein
VLLCRVTRSCLLAVGTPRCSLRWFRFCSKAHPTANGRSTGCVLFCVLQNGRMWAEWQNSAGQNGPEACWMEMAALRPPESIRRFVRSLSGRKLIRTRRHAASRASARTGVPHVLRSPASTQNGHLLVGGSRRGGFPGVRRRSPPPPPPHATPPNRSPRPSSVQRFGTAKRRRRTPRDSRQGC